MTTDSKPIRDPSPVSDGASRSKVRRGDDVRVLFEGRRHVLSGRGNGRLLSIILPVKNAGTELRELLPRIVGQRCDDDIEIIAVDSESVDDTVEVLRAFDATVVAIDPRSFNYGLTRNLAASFATGEFLVFTTARALPADDRWLANLIAPLVSADSVAGVFSRSFPREDADLLTRRDDLDWTYLVGQLPRRRRIRDWDEYRSLSGSEQFKLVIFSNVSAAIRSSVFTQFPFPETTHGEDMLWARSVLEAGYEVCYEPSSVVLRSHRYSFLELFRRNFDAGVSARESAGIRPDLNESAQGVIEAVLSDWLYLNRGCRLNGDEFDLARIEALCHRAAAGLGFCLGANADVFPGRISDLVAIVEHGALSKEVRGYAKRFAKCIDWDSVAADNPGAKDSERPIIEEIQADWLEIGKTGHDASHLQSLQLDAAISRVIEAAATWLRADPSRLRGDLHSRFSLIGTIKAGTLTEEMRAGLNTARPPTPTPSTQDARESPWHGDAHSLLAAIDAYEAEWRTLQARLESMSADYEQEIAHREVLIRDLQAAMQQEIDHRNRTIHDLQAAMDREIGHREGVIVDLRAAMLQESEQRESVMNHPVSVQASSPHADPASGSGEDMTMPAPGEILERMVAVQEEARTQRQELDAIYRSKAWRALSQYWRARTGLQSFVAHMLGRDHHDS